jgi:recombination protein RecA
MDPKLQKIIDKVNKKHGAGTILTGTEIKSMTIPRITTGSLSLDVALGGGWAANQWNEIVGDESHGKTALVLKTVAANQAADPNWVCAWFASEPLNTSYAEMLGVDMDRMIVVEDNTMEVVYQTAIDILSDRAADGIVIDSLPALVSIREEEGTMEDLQPGQAAFLTGKFFRKSSPAIKRSLTDADDRPCTGLIINQWREKIGVQHGDPRTTPGGKAKNFYYYIRVEARRDEWIENTKRKRIGQAIKVRNLKNKTAPPGEVGLVDFYFADGNGHRAGSYDTLKEIVNVGIGMDVIARGGSYYRYAGYQWQGREALVEGLREDETLQKLISEDVMLRIGKPEVESETAPDDDSDDEPVTAPAKGRKVARKKSEGG